MKYTDKYKQVWMYLKTYETIRDGFPAYEGETIVSYFDRLSKYIMGVKNGND